MRVAIVFWLATLASSGSHADPVSGDASREFDEILAMLDTAAISSSCTIGERRLEGDVGARTLSYELRGGDVAVAVTLGEAARNVQWRVSRSIQSGVPYWRLAAGTRGVGSARLEWAVRDSDRVSTTFDISDADGRKLRCGVDVDAEAGD